MADEKGKTIPGQDPAMARGAAQPHIVVEQDDPALPTGQVEGKGAGKPGEGGGHGPEKNINGPDGDRSRMGDKPAQPGGAPAGGMADKAGKTPSKP